MKNTKINKASMIAMAFITVVLFSCATNVLTGQTIKESRDLPAFEGVALAFSGDVYISQGNQQKVEIEADKKTMEIIETKMEGNTLVLKTENGHWRDLGEITVHITMPEVKNLSVSGSGDLVCETTIKTNEINLNVSGSGSISIPKLESPDVSATITGSGDISLAGSASEQSRLNATITGSGDFGAEALPVGNAHITITGSGSVKVNVLKELETNITGSGSVLYKGKPMVNASATGSGKTRSMD